MRITREVKVGLLSLAIIAAFIWGFNYLKGRDIFNSTTEYFVVYKNVEGLTAGRPVTINGYQIGIVDKITFHPDMTGRLIATLQINKPYPFSNGSVAKIYSEGLMGGRNIAIIPQAGDRLAENGDTLAGEIQADMASMLTEEIEPLKKEFLILSTSIDSTLADLRVYLGDTENQKNIQASLANVEALTSKANRIMAKQERNFDETMTNLNRLSGNFADMSDDLKRADLNGTIADIDATFKELNAVLAEVNKGEGSLGKLLKDEKLYGNLEEASKNLGALLEDMKANPKRYVHFSVFGRSGDDPEDEE